jgi:pilus assembly protein Flp/PilA
MGRAAYSSGTGASSYCSQTVTTAGLGASSAGRGSMNLFILKTWLETKLIKDERGANLVEYILLVAFIALIVLSAVTVLQGSISKKFTDASNSLK